MLNVELRGAPGVPPSASLLSSENEDSDIIKNLIKEGLLVVENVKSRRRNPLVCGFGNIVLFLCRYYNYLSF